MSNRVVVVGASHAGVAVVDALRRQGHNGEIVLLSAEEGQPYQRPLMSKSIEYGQLSPERVALKPPSFYADNGVELRLGTQAVAIMPTDKVLVLGDGEVVPYDNLILATGAEPRRFPESLASGVPPLYLRSRNDALTLHSRLEGAGTLAVIGGGLIGLEVAGMGRAMGREVCVYEAAANLLGRVIPSELSIELLDRHRRSGVEFVLGARLKGIFGGNQGFVVVAEGHDPRPYDLVLVAIGSSPRTELAQAAQLTLGNGVATDKVGRTSHKHIWAIGDCADWGGLSDSGCRFEGIQPALEQSRIVARAILGQDGSELPIPRYWSHQGKVRLQTAGAIAEGMSFTEHAAEEGGICLVGYTNGVAGACFSLDAPSAYREALKLLEAARTENTASAA